MRTRGVAEFDHNGHRQTFSATSCTCRRTEDMPDPIQSCGNNSVYDPSAEESAPQACDPRTTSCAPPPAGKPAVVTLEPIVIEGNAGTQALLKKFDQNQCHNDKGAAASACATMVGAATLTGLSAPTVAGLVASASIAFANAVDCARLVSAYNNCVDGVQARGEAIASCEGNGGVPLQSAHEGELVCLVPR